MILNGDHPNPSSLTEDVHNNVHQFDLLPIAATLIERHMRSITALINASYIQDLRIGFNGNEQLPLRFDAAYSQLSPTCDLP